MSDVSEQGQASGVTSPCVDCGIWKGTTLGGRLSGGLRCRENPCACSCHTPAPTVKTFAERGAELGQLVERKQAAYGDSFGRSGEVMRQLYPNGIRVEQLDDALAVVRVVDKLFRIATDRDALGESPWKDIAGYGLLGQARAERSRGGP